MTKSALETVTVNSDLIELKGFIYLYFIGPFPVISILRSELITAITRTSYLNDLRCYNSNEETSVESDTSVTDVNRENSRPVNESWHTVGSS